MHYRIEVDGMVAVHARRALFQALAGVPGVRQATVEMGVAEIDASVALDEAVLRRAITDLGLTVRSLTRQLPLL